MVWWMQPAFGWQTTTLYEVAFRGRLAAREKVVEVKIETSAAMRRGVMGEASPTYVLRVGAGISLANDTEVVGGHPPSRQRVCKVFERLGLGLDLGAFGALRRESRG